MTIDKNIIEQIMKEKVLQKIEDTFDDISSSILGEDAREIGADQEHNGAQGYSPLPNGTKDSNMYAVKIPDPLAHSKAIEYPYPAHIPVKDDPVDMKVEDIAPTWNGEDEVKSDNRFLNLAKDKGDPLSIRRRDVKVSDPMSKSEPLIYPIVQKTEKSAIEESIYVNKKTVGNQIRALRHELTAAREKEDQGLIDELLNNINELRKKRDMQTEAEWHVKNVHVHTDKGAGEESPHTEVFDKKEPKSATAEKVKKDVIQDLADEGAKVKNLKVTKENIQEEKVRIHDPDNTLRMNLHNKVGKVVSKQHGTASELHTVELENGMKHRFGKHMLKPMDENVIDAKETLDAINKSHAEKIKQEDEAALQKHMREDNAEQTGLGQEPMIMSHVSSTIGDPPPSENTEQEEKRKSTPQGFGGEVVGEGISLLALQNRYRKGNATLSELDEAFSKCVDEAKKKKHLKWREKSLKEEDIISEALSKKTDTGFSKSKSSGKISTVDWIHPETGHPITMHTLAGKNELHRVFHDTATNNVHHTHNGKIVKQMPAHVDMLKQVGKDYLIKEDLDESETHYHSIFVKNKDDKDSKWNHHFDADNKQDAADEARSQRNSGYKVKTIRVPKDQADWRKPEHLEAARAKLNEEESLDENFDVLDKVKINKPNHPWHGKVGMIGHSSNIPNHSASEDHDVNGEHHLVTLTGNGGEVFHKSELKNTGEKHKFQFSKKEKKNAKEAAAEVRSYEESIEEHIRKEDGKFVLRSKKSGKHLGTFASKKAALKREGQIEFFKHQHESQDCGCELEDLDKNKKDIPAEIKASLDMDQA